MSVATVGIRRSTSQPRGRYRPRHAAPPTRGLGSPGGRGSRHLVPLLFVLVGIAVMVYPVVASQYNNVKQREFAQSYHAAAAAANPADLSTDLQAARDYNASLKGVPILDPWLTKVSGAPNSGPYLDYLGQLDGLGAMARVRIPSINVDLPADHGTSDDTIAKGLGHLYGTSLPVGGAGTHTVLTSHTGMSNATLLDNLVDVREGDFFFIDVLGETLAYEVDQIKIILPNQIEDLVAEPGADLATLFTCTPYAVNTHRLLVRGHRVPYAGPAAAVAEASAEPGLVMEGWMWLLLGAAGASAVLLVVVVAKSRSNRFGGLPAGR